ncbi:MAG: class I SAM-dependent methyltransferase [Actinomycetota bacterium]|nr:class I SAM-dependent methyltransferase [Actinomycetota bacterium]
MESGRAVVDLLNQLGTVQPDFVTLHIGSGLGRVEYHLRSRVRKCWGVDVSPSMVKRAQRLVPYPNVEFLVSDGATLAHWKDDTFDLIYSFFVFQHLPRAQFERYLREAYVKLASGGRLVFQLIVDEGGMFPDPPPSHPYGLRYYRRSDVEGELSQAGFSVLGRYSPNGHPDDEVLSTSDVIFCAEKPRAAIPPRAVPSPRD